MMQAAAIFAPRLPAAAPAVACICESLYSSPILQLRMVAECVLLQAFGLFHGSADVRSHATCRGDQCRVAARAGLPVDAHHLSPQFGVVREATISLLATIAPPPATPLDAIGRTALLLTCTADINGPPSCNGNLFVETFAVNHMKIILTTHISSFRGPELIELAQFLLGHLERYPSARTFLIDTFARMYALAYKELWLDSTTRQELMELMRPFFNSLNPLHHICAMRLLCGFSSEMLTCGLVPHRAQKYRRVSHHFREEVVALIFQASVSTLQRVLGNAFDFPTPSLRVTYVEAAISLISMCLTYDFIGAASSTDDLSEDTGSLQLPGSWRTILDESFILLLFRCLTEFPAQAVMECIGHAISVRRSLFNEKLRTQWIQTFLSCSLDFLSRDGGVAMLAPVNHELCRTLARFKTFYKISEILTLSRFNEWIQDIAVFSLSYLSHYVWGENGTLFLLQFWAKCAVPGFQPPEVSNMYFYGIAERFLSERLVSLEHIFKFISTIDDAADSDNASNEENPLDDEATIVAQLECFALFARRVHGQICDHFERLMSPLIDEYKAICAISDAAVAATVPLIPSARHHPSPRTPGRTLTPTITPSVLMPVSDDPSLSPKQQSQGPTDIPFSRLRQLQAQLAYLVFVAGGILSAREAVRETEEYEVLDGGICSLILRLLLLHQTRPGTTHLEAGFLYFFTQLRKNYIGESSKRVVLLYASLQQYGLTDQQTVINLITNQCLRIMKMHPNSNILITKCLQLLTELSLGYISSRLLIHAPDIKNMTKEKRELENLEIGIGSRRRLVAILGSIFLVDSSPEETFGQFMRSFETQYLEISKFASLREFRSSVAHDPRDMRPRHYMRHYTHTNEGLVICRQYQLLSYYSDMQGVVASIMSKNLYMLFWDIVYPDKLEFAVRALQELNDIPKINTVIVKFFIEVCLNTHNRINFEPSSAHGIILLRYVSRVLEIQAMRMRKLATYRDEQEVISPESLSSTRTAVGSISGTSDETMKSSSELLTMTTLSLEPPNRNQDEAEFTTKGKKNFSNIIADTATRALNLFRNAISGGYISFGVFHLYRDSALDNSIGSLNDIVKHLSTSDVMTYPSLRTAYFDFFHAFVQNLQAVTPAGPPSSLIQHLIQVIFAELNATSAPSNAPLHSAVATIDLLATAACNSMRMHARTIERTCISKCAAFLRDAFAKWLVRVLNAVIFEEAGEMHWALTRAALPLIIIAPVPFETYRSIAVDGQSNVEARALLSELLHEISNEMIKLADFSARMRDRFASRISTFRRELVGRDLALSLPHSLA